MLNYFILIGKITEKSDTFITLEVKRCVKNEKNEYDSDLLRVDLFENFIKNNYDLIKIGDIVGIKGHIEQMCTLKAEKITFLTTNKTEITQ